VLSERAAQLVDRDGGQRVRVYVHPNHDHSTRLQLDGATGERTDLTRGESHAPIRSHSTVSGRQRRHNAGKSAPTDIRESSQPPPTRVSAPHQTTPAHDDSETGNVSRRGRAEVTGSIPVRSTQAGSSLGSREPVLSWTPARKPAALGATLPSPYIARLTQQCPKLRFGGWRSHSCA
jgi:hypothetical protein